LVYPKIKRQGTFFISINTYLSEKLQEK